VEFIQANVTTTTAGEATEVVSSYLPESRRWIVAGSVSVGETRTLTLAARDPVRLATDALASMLRERGIALEGGVEIDWGEQREVGEVLGSARPPFAPIPPPVRLAGLTSPPLAEVVHPLLDTSQNWMTEQLVRTLGAELGEFGSWQEGFRIIQEHLVAEFGIDSLDLHMEDGSGLSAYNLLTPRAIVRILAHAQMRSWGVPFRTALPTPGRTGGTLDGRLPGLEGRIHAKTGTIMNVNSLSGYLLTNDGSELIFSILTNGSNLPAAAVRARTDAIVREMAVGR
jgi:D-alanyl-D-alanine carboxypeptidase/D-alanyl-D-alanine-endopeptidase (penicillin-binding protein 4)